MEHSFPPWEKPFLYPSCPPPPPPHTAVLASLSAGRFPFQPRSPFSCQPWIAASITASINLNRCLPSCQATAPFRARTFPYQAAAQVPLAPHLPPLRPQTCSRRTHAHPPGGAAPPASHASPRPPRGELPLVGRDVRHWPGVGLLLPGRPVTPSPFGLLLASVPGGAVLLGLDLRCS